MSVQTVIKENLSVSAAVSPSVPTNTSSLSECACLLAQKTCNLFLKSLLLLSFEIVIFFFFFYLNECKFL